MLIATFGPTTAWVGKTVIFEDGRFILEAQGAITPQAIMEYDRQGHLTWEYDELRGWVASMAAASSVGGVARTWGGTGSRLTLARAVLLQRASRGDWVVAGGFLALSLGTSLAWYSFSRLSVGFTAASEVGWGFTAGWLSWLVGLAAIVLVILCSGVVPRVHVDLRGRAPLAVSSLGGLALLIVFVGFIAKPEYDEGFGIGILISLCGAAAVAVGGLLKLGEPVRSAARSPVSGTTGKANKTERIALGAAPVTEATGSATVAPPAIHVHGTIEDAGAGTATAMRTPLWRRPLLMVPLALSIAAAALFLALGPSLVSSKLTPQEIYEQHARSVVVIQATLTGTGGSESGQALGTGFVVSKDGYILTNAHVVSASGQAASTVDVVFRGNASQEITVPGEVVGTDESTDVALIKVDPGKVPGLVPIPFGDSSKIAVGEQVVAIGNPQGLDLSLTSGIVSATDRDLESPNGSTIVGGIQTDAAINPGSSGGPLIDSAGRVIGINEQIDTYSGGNEGIGFAVPINTAVQAMRRMKAEAP